MNKINILFTLLFCITINAISQPFFSKTVLNDSLPNDKTIISNLSGDFDQDGDEDILIYMADEGLVWFDNLLDESSKKYIYNPDMLNVFWDNFADFSFNDIDDDGLKDIAYLYKNKIKYQKNLGNGNFGLPETILYLATTYSDTNNGNDDLHFNTFTISDLDNDGMEDLVIGLQSQLIIAKKTGTKNYQDSLIYQNNIGDKIFKIDVEDLNNDGQKDVVAIISSYQHSNESKILIQSSVFEYDTIDLSTSLSDLSLSEHFEIVDIDGDSQKEILGVFYSQDLQNGSLNSITSYIGYIKVLNNNSLSDINIFEEEVGPPIYQKVHFEDVTGNSQKDIIVNNSEPYVFENLGNGNFKPKQNLPILNSIQSYNHIYISKMMDVDLDGDVDLVDYRLAPVLYGPGIVLTENLEITSYTALYDTISTCNSSFTIPTTGKIISKSQLYTDTLSVDTISFVYIQFNKPTFNRIDTIICQGDFIQIGDSVYNTTGNYENTLTNYLGCDSTVDLLLTVKPATVYSSDTISTNLCSYAINHKIFSTDTIFTDSLTNVNGCDSLATFVLTFDTPEQPEVNEYEHTKISLGTFAYQPDQLLAVDFDDDTDMDIFTTTKFDKLIYLENTGDSYYKKQEIKTSFTNIKQLDKIDYGNDGLYDLLVSFSDNCSLGVIRYDGCNFTDLTLFPCVNDYSVEDIDNNGKSDIVYVENGKVNIFYNGTQLENTGVPSSKELLIADYDNDGSKDIIILKDINEIDVYSNQNGSFTKTQSFTIDNGNIYNINIADMDNDGDNDFVYHYQDATNIYSIKAAYLNNHSVDFNHLIKSNITGTSSEIGNIILGNLTNSPLTDIISYRNGSLSHATEINLHLNAIGPEFHSEQLFFDNSINGYKKIIGDVKISDLNQDGLLDILYSLYESNETLNLPNSVIVAKLNNGDGTFKHQIISNNKGVNMIVNSGNRQFITHLGTQSNDYVNTYNIDVNNFGGVKFKQRDDDLGSENPSTNNFSVPEYNNGYFNEVDYDADGDLDIIVGTYYKKFNLLFENNGTSGYSTKSNIGNITLFNYDAEFKDLDLDGDLDMTFEKGLVWRSNFGNDNGYNWYENLYDWDFVFGQGTVLSFSDLDNDGDNDVLLLDYSSSNIHIYENTGNNKLEFHSTLPENKYFTTMDLDKDGKEDLLFDGVWLKNTGNLNFLSKVYPNSLLNPKAIFDINGDGHDDILYKNHSKLIWALDDGSRTFNLEERIVTTKDQCANCQMKVLDFDYDGDYDILTTEKNGMNSFVKRRYNDEMTIYENHQNSPSNSLDTVFVSQDQCGGSYTWIDGNTYRESTQEIHKIQNKVFVLDLTINHPVFVTDTVDTNIPYTWINGVTYTESEYDVKDTLVAQNGCDSVVSLHLTITPNVYCKAKGNNNKFEWIRRVNLNSGELVNTSGKNQGGYGDYSHKKLHVNIGENITAKLIPGYKNGAKKMYWRVWVDWNNDGDFNDFGERVIQKKGKHAKQGSFTVPNHAIKHKLRMRIAMKRNSFPSSCGTFGRGEVEDYTIKVTANSSNNKKSSDNFDEINNEYSLISVINPIHSGQPIVGKITQDLKGEIQLNIINQLGQIIKSHKVISEGQETHFELPSDYLSAGIYFIQINGTDETVKVIVL
jgi:hypothetical protein